MLYHLDPSTTRHWQWVFNCTLGRQFSRLAYLANERFGKLKNDDKSLHTVNGSKRSSVVNFIN